jgi:hypothetical protein
VHSGKDFERIHRTSLKFGASSVIVQRRRVQAGATQAGTVNQSSLQGTFEPWRVGVLFSRSGHMALIEETQYRGTMLA